MTVTQTGRRMAFTGLLALAASLLPLSAANAQLTADDTAYVVGDTNTEASIKHSRLTYTPLEGDVDSPATEVLIGTADTFADNLAAGTLSGQALDGGRPLFLNDSDSSVSQEILDEIARVTNGADGVTAHILGGDAAQGEGVAEDLEAAGYTVNRFAGATRTETAIAIAEATDNTTVMVVRAFAAADSTDATQAFADSLTAGAVAATLGYDIVFTQTEVLTGSTAAYLAEAGYESAIVVGGTAAISEETEAEVAALIEDTTRVSGATRFDTQIALNELRETPVGPFAIVVDGQEDDAWANAFAAANWSGLANAPVVLTNQGELPQQTEDYLVANHESTFAAHGAANFAFCGTNVTPELCQEIADLQGGTTSEFDAPAPPPPAGNETVTDRPELVSAEIGETVPAAAGTVAKPAGTYVNYVFDEALVAADAGDFYVYTNTNAQNDADAVFEFTPNDESVTVRYNDILTADDLSPLTLATVAIGAAIDGNGLSNSEGSAPIGTEGTSTAGAAGITVAPDLLSLAGFRAGSVADTVAVDFVFDEVVANTVAAAPTAGDYSLILVDGNVADCTGPVQGSTATGAGTIAGGLGTDTVTVICPDTAGGTTVSQAATARGVIVADVVADAAGNQNEAQAADVSASGNSATPDLVSVTFQDNGTAADTAIYTFDENVTFVGTDNSDFFVYNADGTTVAGDAVTTPAPVVSATQPRNVLVTFTEGDLADAVGANVPAGTVNGVTSGVDNLDDEVGVANESTQTITPGTVDAPQLASVTLAPAANAFSSATATFVFTTDVASVTNVGNLKLYQADGTVIPCVAGVLTADTANDTEVTCTFAGTTDANVLDAVLGAVAYNAVDDADGSLNPEGAAVAAGSTGTPV